MKIQLLDLKAQYESIKQEIDEAIERTVNDQNFILGEDVRKLEEEVAVYSGTSYGAGVASGTDALILALKALGIGNGDMVITSPFTFFATAEAISVLGAVPVFVDIDPETYNIDPAKIEEYLRTMNNEQRTRIKAILPVHIYGQCADMDPIIALAEEYGLKVIEDCAQAIGATYKGRKAGSFGDAGCFSFFPSKNLGGFGDGGMVVSDDPEIIDRIKKIRVHGSTKQYIHDEIAYNSRLDNLQAAVLRVKLRKLDNWLEGRRDLAAFYNDFFKNIPVKTPVTNADAVHTFHQYTLMTDRRDELMEYLNDSGISARVYYPVPLHLQPCYASGNNMFKGDLSIAESMAGSVFSIPVYPELTDAQRNYIGERLVSFFN